MCFGPRQDRELVLYLVFEHLEQDLASYMQRMPARSYISPHIIQVSLMVISSILMALLNNANLLAEPLP